MGQSLFTFAERATLLAWLLGSCGTPEQGDCVPRRSEGLVDTYIVSSERPELVGARLTLDDSDTALTAVLEFVQDGVTVRVTYSGTR